MKQTAVEWLEKKFQSLGFDFEHILKQAKELEKEQLKDAYIIGRKGGIIKDFNETFKSK